MPNPSPPLRHPDDIVALERTPYEQAMPVRSTYDLIAAAVARFLERHAFVYLPNGALQTPAIRISYRELRAQIHRAATMRCATWAYSRVAGWSRVIWAISTRTGASTSPGAPRT